MGSQGGLLRKAAFPVGNSSHLPERCVPLPELGCSLSQLNSIVSFYVVGDPFVVALAQRSTATLLWEYFGSPQVTKCDALLTPHPPPRVYFCSSALCDKR